MQHTLKIIVNLEQHFPVYSHYNNFELIVVMEQLPKALWTSPPRANFFLYYRTTSTVERDVWRCLFIYKLFSEH